MLQEGNRMDLTFKTKEGRFNYRVAGVMIHENKLLIMKDHRAPYYYLPGGRVNLHETSTCAILREIKEELQVEGKVNRLLWIHENFFYEQILNESFHEICFYYLIDLPKEFLESSPNHFVMEEHKDRYLSFDWLPLSQLNQVMIYPEFLKEAIYQLPEIPKHIMTYDKKS